MPARKNLDVELLKKLYVFDNLKLREIGEVLGADRRVVANRIKELGLQRAYKDKEWLREQNHINQLNLKQMAKLANCNPSLLSKYMKSYGLEVMTFGSKYRYDYSFFENIDTPEKAYWLGFVVADGGIEVTKNSDRGTYRLRFLLACRDAAHLEKLKKSLKTNIELHFGETMLNGKAYENVSLSINSKKIVEDLINLNVLPKKSANEVMPNGVPNHLVNHFLRGEFDGDGCFSYWINSREGLQQEFSFLGSERLMESFKGIISSNLGTIGTVYKEGILYKLRFTKIHDIANIIKWLYPDEEIIYLDRKYQKINEWKNLRIKQGNSIWHPHIKVEDIV